MSTFGCSCLGVLTQFKTCTSHGHFGFEEELEGAQGTDPEEEMREVTLMKVRLCLAHVVVFPGNLSQRDCQRQESLICQRDGLWIS